MSRRSWLAVLPGLYAGLARLGVAEALWFRALYGRAYFAYKRHLEDPYARLVARHPELFRAGHVIDVGANVGYTASVFAGAVASDARVFAFEPDARSFADLEGNLARLGLTGNVEALRCAVGETEGELSLLHNPGHPGDHRVLTDFLRARLESAPESGPVASVPVTSLDRFCRERLAGETVSFVKVDVQGYEVAVARGMRELAAQSQQTAFAFEWAPAGMRELGFDPRELLDGFRGAGYGVHVIEPAGDLHAASDAELDADRPLPGYIELLMLRPGRLPVSAAVSSTSGSQR